MSKTINHILLYKENSDAACTVAARYFHSLDNARKAMRDDFDKQNAILHFPKATSAQDCDNFTDIDENTIAVNMGIDSFVWRIIVDAQPEDALDDPSDDTEPTDAEGVYPNCGV